MSRYHYLGLILLVFVVSLFAPAKSDGQLVRRVLLLNSYNRDMLWTDSITRGVSDVLSKDSTSYKLYVEHMDTKNYFSPEYLELLKEQYRFKYSNVEFDAVIVSDDNAANFAASNRSLFNNAPVVFCGVNDLDFQKTHDMSNMTGVLEFTDVRMTIEAALQLQPNLKRVYVVVDDTTTGMLSRKQIQDILPDYRGRLDFAWIEKMSMSEVKETISNLAEESAVLLASFNRDRLDNWYTYTESITQLRSVTSVPIYGMWDFYLGRGIVGGMITSGYRHGVMAAEMALDIINGIKPFDIEVVTQDSNQYMFDYKELEYFELNPELTPKNSVVINKPINLYERYRSQILIAALLVLTMVLFIFKLLASNRARRRVENELEEMNKYQESLIEQRTEELVQRSRELEMANHELKKVDNLKTAVVNTVSHDLRTPLTSVLGFCKIIERDFIKYFEPLCSEYADLGERSERIRKNLGIIESEGERLTRLINDFLDLSKIDAGEIAWNDVSIDTNELFVQALPILEGYFTGTAVKFHMDVDDNLPGVVADPDRLLQVLNNLVGNAAKFTFHGLVNLRVTTTEGGWLKATVSDTGMGIPKEELANIFDKFYQVTQSTINTNIARGSGMGLAISKRIVEHYGGMISAESEHEYGSSFTFTIPTADR